MDGWFSWNRDGGFRAMFETSAISVMYDKCQIWIVAAFATAYFVGLLGLIGTRKARVATFFVITMQVLIGYSIVSSFYAVSWRTGCVVVNSQYKAFSSWQGDQNIAIGIGLNSMNVTLSLNYPKNIRQHESVLKSNLPVAATGPIYTIHNAIRLAPPRTEDKHLDLNEFLIAGFDNRPQLYRHRVRKSLREKRLDDSPSTIPSFNITETEELYFCENFNWEKKEDLSLQTHRAKLRGLPNLIIFALDAFETPFKYGTGHRTAGYYSGYLLSLALAAWLASIFLYFIVSKYGAYMNGICGVVILVTTITYDALVPKGSVQFGDGSQLVLGYGSSFVLLVVSGCLSILFCLSIIGIEKIWPNKFATVLENNYNTPYSYRDINIQKAQRSPFVNEILERFTSVEKSSSKRTKNANTRTGLLPLAENKSRHPTSSPRPLTETKSNSSSLPHLNALSQRRESHAYMNFNEWINNKNVSSTLRKSAERRQFYVDELYEQA